MSALFRQDSLASQATAMTLFLQRPEAHLPLMLHGDVRVSVPAIESTIDLFDSLNATTREQLWTFDISHLEGLHPVYPGEISRTLERLARRPVLHHDAIAALARHKQVQGVHHGAADLYRLAMTIPHADNPVDRLFYATALFQTSPSAEVKAELVSARDKLRSVRGDDACVLAYLALSEWVAAEVYEHEGDGTSVSFCQAAAEMTIKELVGTPGHVAALHRMATRALRAGLWCFGLMDYVSRLDPLALEMLMSGILNEEIARSRRFTNVPNTAKLFFEAGLAAHARGDLSSALEHYDEAYSQTAPAERTRMKDWKRALAVLIAVCEEERDNGPSHALVSRIQRQIQSLKGDPVHAGLRRCLDAVLNRLLNEDSL